MSQILISISRAGVCFLALVGLIAGSVRAESTIPRPSEIDLLQFIPTLIQASNLAILNPEMAARLVPEQLVASAVVGAQEIVADEAQTFVRKDEPRVWPVGPWASSGSLVATIESVYPESFGSLYHALEPRLKANCRAATPAIPDCDALFRKAASRLLSPAISARTAGNVAIPVTGTQRELARLGPEVTSAMGAKLRAVAGVVWGAGEIGPNPPSPSSPSSSPSQPMPARAR